MYNHLGVSRNFIKKFGKLHVIVPCFNPLRFVSRYILLRDFIRRTVDAGAELWVAEVAFGGRPWEVTEGEGRITDETGRSWNQLQFRSKDEIWVKESLINAAVACLPHDWEYMAWLDGDINLMNPDWVQETIQQLQHYSVVQMFEQAIDLSPNGTTMGTFKGVPASLLNGDPWPRTDYYYGKKGYFHPGYGWAYRNYAWHKMGGLLDINIVGGGDHQMAYGLYGKIDKAIPFKSTQGYRQSVFQWQNNVVDLKHNVGFVPGTLIHYWHGKKVNRGYFDRWKILANNNFNPFLDLKKDIYGLWQLTGNKPKLRDDLRAYFRARQEDGIDL